MSRTFVRTMELAPVDPDDEAATAIPAVCDRCWNAIDNPELGRCACGKPRPLPGWPLMPVLFRDRYRLHRCTGRDPLGARFIARDEAQTSETWVTVVAVDQTPDGDLLARKRMMSNIVGMAARLSRLAPEERGQFVGVLDYAKQVPAYFTLEAAVPPTLLDVLAEEPHSMLPTADVLRIGTQLLEALDKLHNTLGRSHGGLHPSRILVDRAGEVRSLRLSGFERSMAFDEALTDDSRVPLGHALDELVYVAPEAADGFPVASVAADIYAVGAVLFRAAAGRVPHVLPAGSTIQMARSGWLHRTREPLICAPQVPAGLFQVLTRALDPEPSRRFPSARAMKDALGAAAFREQAVEVAPTLLDSSALLARASGLLQELLPFQELIRAVQEDEQRLRETPHFVGEDVERRLYEHRLRLAELLGTTPTTDPHGSPVSGGFALSLASAEVARAEHPESGDAIGWRLPLGLAIPAALLLLTFVALGPRAPERSGASSEATTGQHERPRPTPSSLANVEAPAASSDAAEELTFEQVAAPTATVAPVSTPLAIVARPEAGAASATGTPQAPAAVPAPPTPSAAAPTPPPAPPVPATPAPHRTRPGDSIYDKDL